MSKKRRKKWRWVQGGKTQRELAAEHGVHQSTISHVVNSTGRYETVH